MCLYFFQDTIVRMKIQKLFGALLGIIIQIAPITIGSIYKKDCPVEPIIPIWCIIHGSLTMTSSFVEIFIALRRELHEQAATPLRIINAFLAISFTAGCVFTYRNYEPEYIAPLGGIIFGEANHYCNKTLYIFTFWYITTHFIVVLISMFCRCCYCAFIVLGLNNRAQGMDMEALAPEQMDTTYDIDNGSEQLTLYGALSST